MIGRRLLAAALIMPALLLVGCTIFGAQPVPTPTITVDGGQPPAEGPALSMTSDKSSVEVGQQVTITGQLERLGIPQYTLALRDASNNMVASHTVTYDGTLGATPGGTGALFDLVSATGGMTTVTYVLRATSPGTVSLVLTANGEAANPDGTFVMTNASANPLTLNVTAPAAAQLGLNVSHTSVNRDDLIGFTITPPAGAGLTNFALTLTATGAEGTPTETYRVQAGAAGTAPEGAALFRLDTASANAEGATFVLKALRPGTFSVQAGAGPDAAAASVQSPQVQFTVNEQTSAVKLGFNADATSVQTNGQIVLTVTNDRSIDFQNYALTLYRESPQETGAQVVLASLGQPFAAQPAGTGALFEVVAASATETGATFTLKGIAPGALNAIVNAGRAIATEGGLGPQVTGITDPLALTVSGAAGSGGPDGQGGQQAAGTGYTYTVRRGDTLYSIGRRFGVNWQDIATSNSIAAPYLIKAGATLTIPGIRSYTVKAGDGLMAIGRALGVDWRAIARQNGLAAPYRIQVGQVLIIPG